MPKQHGPIEPKPTQYGNTLFRSRLEARWAVFLDYSPNVLNWEYEPKTFRLKNGWTYTPDFKVVFFPAVNRGFKVPIPDTIYLEVKPKRISSQYRGTLSVFASRCDIMIMVAQGSFYGWDTEHPRAGIYTHLHIPGRRHQVPITTDMIFPHAKGYYHAQHFRFDLEE